MENMSRSVDDSEAAGLQPETWMLFTCSVHGRELKILQMWNAQTISRCIWCFCHRDAWVCQAGRFDTVASVKCSATAGPGPTGNAPPRRLRVAPELARCSEPDNTSKRVALVLRACQHDRVYYWVAMTRRDGLYRRTPGPRVRVALWSTSFSVLTQSHTHRFGGGKAHEGLRRVTDDWAAAQFYMAAGGHGVQMTIGKKEYLLSHCLTAL